jgi:HlyD family secretion protein
MKRKKIILISVVILAIAAPGYWLLTRESSKQVISYETTAVKLGSISNTVTATGTIEPVKQVSVGTQVSGVIQKIYVDFNSKVRKGQLLAELDKTPLLAQLASIEADQQSAESQYTYQLANYNRIKQLFEKKAVSETDYETALYQYSSAKANVAKMKSEVDKAHTNLSYTMIYSPIDGVVLNRAVDEGQTVAASFNTPTLFTIAQDLTKMQVVANVDEADIGQVMEGQKVTFTVDAYPDDNFIGMVRQVRLMAVTNSNVVTYSVVIDAPNPDLKLKPGLTASIVAYTREVNNALTIPAKALRFKPDSSVISQFSLSNNAMSAGTIDPLPGGAKASTIPSMGQLKNTGVGKSQISIDKSLLNEVESESMKTIWVKDGEMIHPVQVKTGLTDETNIEIKSGLRIGEMVVISSAQIKASELKTESTSTQSPFMPKRPGSKK